MKKVVHLAATKTKRTPVNTMSLVKDYTGCVKKKKTKKDKTGFPSGPREAILQFNNEN
jgi:uncharacterized protein (DUF362 family)